MGEVPEQIRQRFRDLKLPPADVLVLADDLDTAHFFDHVISAGAPAKAAANWIMGDIMAFCKVCHSPSIYTICSDLHQARWPVFFRHSAQKTTKSSPQRRMLRSLVMTVLCMLHGFSKVHTVDCCTWIDYFWDFMTQADDLKQAHVAKYLLTYSMGECGCCQRLLCNIFQKRRSKEHLRAPPPRQYCSRSIPLEFASVQATYMATASNFFLSIAGAEDQNDGVGNESTMPCRDDTAHRG